MTNSSPLIDPSPVPKIGGRRLLGIHSRYWRLWLFSPLIIMFCALFLGIGIFMEGFICGYSGGSCKPPPFSRPPFWQFALTLYLCGALFVAWIAYFEKKALAHLDIDAYSAFDQTIFYPWQTGRLSVATSPADTLQRAADMLAEYGAVLVRLDEGNLVQAVTAHSWRGYGRKITISVSSTTPCDVVLEVSPRMPILFLIIGHRLVTDYGDSWKLIRALKTRIATGSLQTRLSTDNRVTADSDGGVDTHFPSDMASTWQRIFLNNGVLLLFGLNFNHATVLPDKELWVGFVVGLLVEMSVYFTIRKPLRYQRSTELRESVEFALYNFWIILVLFVALSKPSKYWTAGENISFFVLTAVVLVAAIIGLRDIKSEREQRILAKTRRENVELERQLTEAKLVALSAQIEPHFLFNTLASIQYLIRNDTNKAGEMTSDLIRYLRLALPRMKQATARLVDELDLVRAYLGIMQIRMGERLQFEVDYPDELGNVQIPTMTLITLVENAIKHGLEQKPAGGMINLTIDRDVKDPRILRLEVADTGGGFSTAASGTGIGLANIRERLHTLYGNRARLDLEANQPSGVKAILIIPIEKK